jgi:hypothetical protein
MDEYVSKWLIWMGCFILWPFNVTDNVKLKVETPIHDSIRELVTWVCKEHGVKS